MKFVLAFMAALFVTSFSVCAADLDSVDYYELDPVQLSPMTASALDYGIALAASAEWSTTDSSNLASIEDSLTNTVSSVTVAGMLYDIVDYTEYMPNMNTQLNHIAGYLHGVSSNNLADDVYEIRRGISNVLTSLSSSNSTLTNFYNLFNLRNNEFTYGYVAENGDFVSQGVYGPFQLKDLMTHVLVGLAYDGSLARNRQPTLFSLVKDLKEVLASDADIELSQSQEANRQAIEDTFLTGSSGSTSLGASDFGDLSDVGGSVKDMLSLEGNASVSSFVSGMTSADSVGSGWFSETTRSQLDSVTSSASTYSRSDPYNMSGWQDRYYWLIGDDENG